MNTSIASKKDITALCSLINRAYRGADSKKGWTSEADFFNGPRIDQESLLSLFEQAGALFLICRSNQGKMLGCAYLKKRIPVMYLGLLTVEPSQQNMGTGKLLLSASEKYAREQKCTVMEMTVISKRIELLGWYRKKDYLPTGESRPFPTDDKFGLPREPLEFLVLQKVLPQ